MNRRTFLTRAIAGVFGVLATVYAPATLAFDLLPEDPTPATGWWIPPAHSPELLTKGLTSFEACELEIEDMIQETIEALGGLQ